MNKFLVVAIVFLANLELGFAQVKLPPLSIPRISEEYRYTQYSCMESELMNDMEEVAYVTEPDENGILRTMQLLPRAKVIGKRFANTGEKLSSGDVFIVWKIGWRCYLIKCDKNLPFKAREEEARKWGLDKLGYPPFFGKNNAIYRYPLIMCVQ